MSSAMTKQLLALPADELRDACDEHGLPTSGTKKELVARILGISKGRPSEKTSAKKTTQRKSPAKKSPINKKKDKKSGIDAKAIAGLVAASKTKCAALATTKACAMDKISLKKWDLVEGHVAERLAELFTKGFLKQMADKMDIDEETMAELETKEDLAEAVAEVLTNVADEGSDSDSDNETEGEGSDDDDN